MVVEIVPRMSPEEEELVKKHEELALLQAELADCELYLTNLRAELSAFEAHYLREVGALYAELDDWNAKIAELDAEEEGSEQARSAATQARVQAKESFAAAHGEAARAMAFTPSPKLKSLYREFAKRVHPDLATDEADRGNRERFMARANNAYHKGDADEFKRIVEEYESSPEAVKGIGVALDLVRVIRQLRQLRRRLAQIQLEIAALNACDVAELKIRADEASNDGRNLLAEMAQDVRRRIDIAQRLFEAKRRDDEQR